MSSYLLPATIAVILLYGIFHRTDVFSAFLRGAREGIDTALGILPALVALMTCVGMFRASGGLDFLCSFLSPLFPHLPQAVLPLACLRPVSGSGSLAVLETIFKSEGVNSSAGRIAAILFGSGETLLYVLTLYYSATRVKNTRHTALYAFLGYLAAIVGSIFFSQFF